MQRGLARRVWTYLKNLGIHLALVARRRESLREAWAAAARDARKLGRPAQKPESKGNRREAMALVEKGRREYNVGQDRLAEGLFRDALHADSNYALAYTYLGNTLYRQGRAQEATHYWTRAIVAEPDSDAARKARLKLQRVARKKAEFNEWLDDRLKDD